MKKLLIVGQQHFIDSTIASNLPKDDDTDIEIYFGDEIKLSEFYAYANSPSLFGDDKYAIVRKVDNISDVENFIENTKNCIETNIILSAEKMTDKFVKLYKAAGYDTKIEPKGANVTPDDVKHIFEKYELKISSSNAKIIAEQMRGDMMLAENEAIKLSLYLADNQDKSVDKLIEHVSGEREENIYHIVDAFSIKNSKNALLIYDKIKDSDKEVQAVFFNISSRMIDIYYAHINNRLLSGKHDFVIKKTNDYKRYWTRQEASKMIGYLSMLDVNIKSGKTTVNDAVTEILTSIA